MRRRRDWYTDIALFVFAMAFAVVSADSVATDADMSRGAQIADQVAGALACATVFLRRRWPVQVAVVLLLAGTYFHYLTGATLVALFSVAVLRPLRVTAAMAGVTLAQLVLFLARDPDPEHEATNSALTYFALVAGTIGWGLYVRKRRQLIASLEERAERAAGEARRQAREEIAREMHDVLAHRLSLLSMHAGALEFHPGASTAQVQRAAGVIRESAHLALEDLREVIGVLRASEPADSGGAGHGRPQPTLADLGRLVAESREAGMRISYEDRAAEPDAVTTAVGRTAYRIVQEGLTNARKHAPDAEVTVEISGGPRDGITLSVVNPLARREVERGIPGAGQGLIGLAERASLAGGHLEHGVENGDFALRAWLPWHGAKGAGG
ncbi:sensor histidine kinase [Streptomyces flavofungini]|uniref:sensor histidine kinase n=1 Tax=Streptomyces flavofungini TaxID=68200 RepID=UPI0025AFBF4F|nr:histidine kinase [Streptomyces flavofungini]WJV50303.1 histidine kinase [Streptomyces flavofungini]